MQQCFLGGQLGHWVFITNENVKDVEDYLICRREIICWPVLDWLNHID